MAKLDRLGWAAGTGGTCFGVRVGVRVSDADALAEATSRLPPGWSASPESRVQKLYSVVVGGEGSRPGTRRMNLVYEDARLVVRTADRDEAMAGLESRVRLYVAERARRRVFVHAGVVGWGGRAILIPGRSHTGKSRLVQALVKAGATYYSDEYAVLDGSGRVHAFPAALSLRGDAGAPGRRVPARDLGGHDRLPALRVGLVVVSPYVPGGRASLRRLTTGGGALALLANCVPARRRPAEVLSSLSKAVRDARVLRGVRDEAAAAALHLLTVEAFWREGAA
jgi:hypothetical protein